jgi:hypothetical protein
MNSTSASVPGDAVKAGRAKGAMFFAVFGGLWLVLWAHAEFPGSLGSLLAVAALAALLMVAAYRVYKANALGLKALAQAPEGRRRARMFNLVNAAQWSVIVVVALVLSQTGHATLILPAAILIIGLHFLPLARLFAYPPHYLTGAAMMVLACVYPLMAPEGPESDVGALGAGLILWLSALWAISPFSRIRGQVSNL